MKVKKAKKDTLFCLAAAIPSLILSLMLSAAGCNPVWHVNEDPTEVTTVEDNPRVVKSFWGNPEELPLQEGIFLPETEHSESKEGYLKKWNDKAMAEIRVVDEDAAENNCRVNYQSALGSLKDFPVTTATSVNNFFYNIYFFEADMNGDGAEDLVIKTFCDAGVGMTREAIYIYDFKNNTTIVPFEIKNYSVLFTAEQENSILQTFQKWENDGLPEIRWVNNKTLSKLYYNNFISDVVKYKDKTAIKVRFSNIETYLSGDEYRDSYCEAVFVYDGLSQTYVLDKAWYRNPTAEKETAPKQPSVSETQKESEQIRALWGVKESLTNVEEVFAYKDYEDLKKIRTVTETGVKWQTEQAQAQIDRAGQTSYSINAKLSYHSAAGSVDGLSIAVLRDQLIFTDFFEADMNGDGAKDLVIRTVCSADSSSKQCNLYVYDFQSKTCSQPCRVDAYTAGFTEEQEKSILKKFQEWDSAGMTDIRKVNRDSLSQLYYKDFRPTVVRYQGKSAIAVEFYDSNPKYEEYSLCRCTAVLVYQDGSYTVSGIWCVKTR